MFIAVSVSNCLTAYNKSGTISISKKEEGFVMANVYDVANYILESVGGKMSTMQLQKLCYYAKAWNLAWDDDALFNERFLKWENGPVCRELYDLHKGKFYVDASLIPKNKLTRGLTDDQRMNIDYVIEDYGKLSGTQLSRLSHSEEPYINTQSDAEIKDSLIKAFYSSSKVEFPHNPTRYNEETLASLKEADQIIKELKEGKRKGYASMDELFAALNADDV